jgi:hypothetical protein
MGHRGGFGHPHWPKGVAIYVLISSFFLNFFFFNEVYDTCQVLIGFK